MTPTVARWVEKSYIAESDVVTGEWRHCIRLDPPIEVISDDWFDRIIHTDGAFARLRRLRLQLSSPFGPPIDSEGMRSSIYIFDHVDEWRASGDPNMLTHIDPKLMGPDPSWEYVAWSYTEDELIGKTCIGYDKRDRLIRHHATLEPQYNPRIGTCLIVQSDFEYSEAGPSEWPNLDPAGYLTFRNPFRGYKRLDANDLESLEHFVDSIDAIWVRGDTSKLETILDRLSKEDEAISALIQGCESYRGRWDNWRSRISKAEVIHGVREPCRPGADAVRPVWGAVCATVVTTARLDTMPFAVSIVSRFQAFRRWGRWRFLTWDIGQQLLKNADIQKYAFSQAQRVG